MSSTIAVARMSCSVAQEDESLATRFATGDEAAFCAVVACYEPRVVALARRLLGWRDEVDDVVQEVFLAALKKQRSFRGDSKLSTWLAGITVNQCRRHRRGRFRRLAFLSRLWTDTDGLARAREEHPLTANEDQAQVRAAISELPLEFREVVVLRYLEEMSAGEIASVVGVSTNLVNVRLTRAKEKLQKSLARLMENQS